MVKIKDLDTALSLVTAQQKAFQDSLATSRDEAKANKEKGDNRKYAVMAEAYGLCLQLLEDEDMMVEVLTSFNLGKARKGSNEFFPLVKALYRKPAKGGGTEFDKSAGKYANVMRYARDHGWSAKNFPASLAGLKLEVGGKTLTRLQAAEMADRRDHADEDESSAFTAELAFEHLLTKPVQFNYLEHGIIDIQGATDGMYAAVACRYEHRLRSWVPVTAMPDKSDAVKNRIAKPLIEVFEHDYRETMEELARANETADALNSMPKQFREVYAKKQARKQAEQPLDPDLFEDPNAEAAGNDQEPADVSNAA